MSDGVSIPTLHVTQDACASPTVKGPDVPDGDSQRRYGMHVRANKTRPSSPKVSTPSSPALHCNPLITPSFFLSSDNSKAGNMVLMVLCLSRLSSIPIGQLHAQQITSCPITTGILHHRHISTMTHPTHNPLSLACLSMLMYISANSESALA